MRGRGQSREWKEYDCDCCLRNCVNMRLILRHKHRIQHTKSQMWVAHDSTFVLQCCRRVCQCLFWREFFKYCKNKSYPPEKVEVASTKILGVHRLSPIFPGPELCIRAVFFLQTVTTASEALRWVGVGWGWIHTCEFDVKFLSADVRFQVQNRVSTRKRECTTRN